MLAVVLQRLVRVDPVVRVAAIGISVERAALRLEQGPRYEAGRVGPGVGRLEAPAVAVALVEGKDHTLVLLVVAPSRCLGAGARPVALARRRLLDDAEQLLRFARDRVRPRHILVDTVVQDLPSDQVLRFLVDPLDAEGVVVAQSTLPTQRELIGFRRLNIGMEEVPVVLEARRVRPWAVQRGPGLGDVGGRIRRRRVPVAGHVRVVELAVEGSEDLPVANLVGHADPRRDQRPVDHIRDTRDDVRTRAPVLVQTWKVRNLAVVLVVPHAKIQRQVRVDLPGIVDERRHGPGVGAVVEGPRRDPVVGRIARVVLVAIEVHAVRAAAGTRVAATGAVRDAELEVVVAAQQVVGVVRELHVQLVAAKGPPIRVARAAAGLGRTTVRRRVVRVGRRGTASSREQVVLAAVPGVHDFQVVVRRQDRLELQAPGRIRSGLVRDRVGRRVWRGVGEAEVLVVVLRLHQVAVVERRVDLEVVSVGWIGSWETGVDARLAVGIARVLDRTEEPHLVARERAAQRARRVVKLLAMERNALDIGVLLREAAVLVVPVDRAAEVVRAGLGHHVERGAGHAAVLSRRADSKNLNLIDDRGVQPPVRVARVGRSRIQSVDAPRVGRRARSEGGHRGAALRTHADPRRHGNQIPEVPVGRQIVDEVGRVAGAHARAGHVQDRRRGHRDLLLDRLQGEFDLQVHRRADAHPDALDPVFLEAVQSRGHEIVVDRKRRHDEAAAGAGDRGPRQAAVLDRRRHGDAGQAVAVRVTDLAADVARRLGGGSGRQHQKRCGQRQNSAGSAQCRRHRHSPGVYWRFRGPRKRGSYRTRPSWNGKISGTIHTITASSTTVSGVPTRR